MDKDSIKTSKTSKILVIIIVLSIVFVIGLSFYKYFVKEDFSLYVKQTCNPTLETCFVHECEEEDIRCSSLPDGLFYYKIIYQKQYKAPVCTDLDCPPITCDANDIDCSVYYCSEESLAEFELGDTCSS